MRIHTFSVLAAALIAMLELSEAKPQWFNVLPQAYGHGYGLPACGVNGLPFAYCGWSADPYWSSNAIPAPPPSPPPSTNTPSRWGNFNGNFYEVRVLWQSGSANRGRSGPPPPPPPPKATKN